MAPVAPKRKTLRLKAAERLANPLAPRKVHRPDSVVSDGFLDTKRDKRLIKHSAFLSKITKPTTTTKASRKNAKRHDKKKLQTNLESLVDALPELTHDEVSRGQTEKDGRVRHKSLKSKPGALKKKERVVRGEMERFGMSLAQLSTVKEAGVDAASSSSLPAAQIPSAPLAALDDDMMEDVHEGKQQQKQQPPPPPPSSAANRFAALRGFISATMEQNPAFAQRAAAPKGP